MPNYSRAKIYRLVCDDPELVYYGSTTLEKLCNRLSQHTSGFKHKNQTKVTAHSLYEVGGVKIELVEDFPCENKDQLRAREAFYIRNNLCVNKKIPGRTPREYAKDHPEKTKEWNRKTYLNSNKAEKINCDLCDTICRRDALLKHKKRFHTDTL
jgi:hypothetical protein